jgi:hypothetical protein
MIYLRYVSGAILLKRYADSGETFYNTGNNGVLRDGRFASARALGTFIRRDTPHSLLYYLYSDTRLGGGMVFGGRTDRKGSGV